MLQNKSMSGDFYCTDIIHQKVMGRVFYYKHFRRFLVMVSFVFCNLIMVIYHALTIVKNNYYIHAPIGYYFIILGLFFIFINIFLGFVISKEVIFCRRINETFLR